jgi:citrate lyase synthetase
VSVCKLYCGDKKLDSAVQSLLALKDTLDFQIEIIEIPRSIVSVSATDVRKWIQEKNHSKLNKYLKKNTLKILKEAS